MLNTLAGIVVFMKFAPLFDPDARREPPEPVRLDLKHIFLPVTVLWFLADLGFIIASLLGHTNNFALLTCSFGLVIGMLMLIWEHCFRDEYRKLGDS